MMENNRWEDIAPEIPAEFHEKFEQTLAGLERKPSGKRIKFRVLMAVAAVCALCTATVAADGIFHWSDAMLERFKPSEEQKQELADKGVVREVGQSVTQNGVTITLTEALQDSRSIYMLFEVETPDSMEMDDTVGFEEGLSLLVDGKYVWDALGGETGGSGGGSFISTMTLADQTPHKRYYEMRYNFDERVDFSGKTLETSLRNLTINADKAETGDILAEGDWNFKWQADKTGGQRRIDVNQTYDFGGYDICISYIELSPLGSVVYADYADAMEVEKDERNTFTYTGDDPGMEVCDRIGIYEIEYNDGTRLKGTDVFGGGGGACADEASGYYSVREGFNRLVDVDNIKALYLMKGEVCVPVA